MLKKPLNETCVIIADDQELNLNQNEELLIKLGIDFNNIFRAHTGKEVISLLNRKEEGSIDLILCDWNMPQGTGLKVLENLRGRKDHQQVPFIMVTTQTDRSAIIKALKLKATDYIIKPIDENIFREKVYKALGVFG